MEVMTLDEGIASLRDAFVELQAANPKVRIRDAAEQLCVSECELVVATMKSCCTALDQNFAEQLKAMPSLGRVMCLTRNETSVHERKGCFEKVSVNGKMGLVLGSDIDLRLLMSDWQAGFYLVQKLASGTRKSFQYFDRHGEAIIKIYLLDESDEAAAEKIVSEHGIEDPTTHVEIQPKPEPTALIADDEIDVEGLRTRWRSMTDPHQFFGLLKKFKVGREQALRLAGDEFTQQLPLSSVAQMMEVACKNQQAIMVFVANRGCIQIHSGAVSKYAEMGEWLNILDEPFNLHLRSERFTSAWYVRKPSDDGDISSIEVFDEDGMAVQFFGARKPGIPERQDWKDLLQEVVA